VVSGERQGGVWGAGCRRTRCSGLLVPLGPYAESVWGRARCLLPPAVDGAPLPHRSPAPSACSWLCALSSSHPSNRRAAVRALLAVPVPAVALRQHCSLPPSSARVGPLQQACHARRCLRPLYHPVPVALRGHRWPDLMCPLQLVKHPPVCCVTTAPLASAPSSAAGGCAPSQAGPPAAVRAPPLPRVHVALPQHRSPPAPLSALRC